MWEKEEYERQDYLSWDAEKLKISNREDGYKKLEKIQGNVYISCPIANSLLYLIRLNEQLNVQCIGNVKRWIREDTYDKNMVEDCDIFILCLPNFDFKIKRPSLPPGCRKELDKAKKLGKKIYIAYEKVNNEYYDFYEYYEGDVLIGGLPGTNNYIFDNPKPQIKKPSKKLHTTPKKALPLLIR